MKYCLIGEKLGHSYSKIIHEKLGLNYSLKELNSVELDKFLKSPEYDGFNVTIPYKKDVIPYMSYMSDTAKLAGAVNTVVNKNGKLYGYNTDVDGMNYMILDKGVSLTNKSVMILGSGGTSNTAVSLCKREKASVYYVVSRNGDINYQNCYNYQDVQIIINTTPVGMFPNVENSPIDLSKFKNLIAVFDCIYNPKTTELLNQAKNLGLIYNGGLPMLVKQAILAYNIWKGVEDNDSITKKIISEIEGQTKNIVLIGMPSAGKTTIGKLVSSKLDKEFYDSDDEITKKYGKTPAQIINEEGEESFRDKESVVIKELSLKRGVVISLGGGGVLRSENVKNLKRNGVIIYVKRDLSLLDVSNRPLSQKQGVELLYQKRKGIYESVSDYAVENNGLIDDCYKKVIKNYENSCN